MNALWFLVLIALLGAGTVSDIKAGQARDVCRVKNGVPEYNLLIVLAAGMSVIVALFGAMFGNWVLAVAALVVSVLVTFPYLKESIEMLPRMKKEGWGSGGMLPFQPYWVWGRIVLWGMGKWVHVLFVCTLVGIPLYNMLKQVSINMDALQEQIELRQEYERLRGKK